MTGNAWKTLQWGQTAKKKKTSNPCSLSKKYFTADKLEEPVNYYLIQLDFLHSALGFQVKDTGSSRAACSLVQDPSTPKVRD